ncbi:MAG: squalene/phytoene synthase family protein [Candidatus Dormibacteraeota bacterium]|nr:squalene/phytoene synthase family protein [Candidatus Dormibacteraeota bacterium]
MSAAEQRPASVAAADVYCNALLRHYENFTVASRLSPRTLRRDLARVYAFCRTTDDIGDETGDPERATERLLRWREDVVAMFDDNVPPEHPVLLALNETVVRHRMPRQPFLDLIAANLQDQHVTGYEDWPALHAYCSLSAAPVGRMVLRVNGYGDTRRTELSDAVCIGLQLANFAQDVGVDAGKGRCYLLQTDVRAGGTTAAVRALCDRARQLLDRGRALEASVGPRLRVQLALYRLGGNAILDAIARAGYRTESIRPAVSTRDRGRIASTALLTALQRRPAASLARETVRGG